MGLKALQLALKALGFDPGPLDGIRGPQTEKAVKDWLASVRMEPSADDPPDALPNAPVIPWVAEFMKVFGLHEVRDKAKLSKWLRSDGKTLGDPTALPWCGDGMDTAISRSLPEEPRLGPLKANPYWALNWKHFGIACAPCYGAVAAFVRDGGGHVGVLDGQSKTHYRVLGANQKDSISYTWILKSQCKAIRWPSTYPNPNIPLPFKKQDGTPASSKELA
ncbi:MAG: peptidoglycan-binding protein [Beijerinckiaceae bacterium]